MYSVGMNERMNGSGVKQLFVIVKLSSVVLFGRCWSTDSFVAAWMNRRTKSTILYICNNTQYKDAWTSVASSDASSVFLKIR